MVNPDSIVEQRIAQQLGLIISQLRNAAGLTQEEVALRSGINRNHYRLIEHGFSDEKKRTPSNPRLFTLISIARTLGTTPEELISAARGRA